MINFRFHIVSLIAVFLALAVGIVDRCDGHQQRDRRPPQQPDRHRRGERERSEGRERPAAKRGRRARGLHRRHEGLRGHGPPRRRHGRHHRHARRRRDAVKQTVELAQQAGARAPAILWLEEKLDARRRRQRSRSSARSSDDPVRPPRPRATQAWSALATATRDRRRSAPDGRICSPRSGDAGFVQFEPVGDSRRRLLRSRRSRAPDARVLPRRRHRRADHRQRTSRCAADQRGSSRTGCAVVVGEVFGEEDGGPDRGAILARHPRRRRPRAARLDGRRPRPSSKGTSPPCSRSPT